MPDVVKCHLVAAGKYHDIDFARLEILKLLAEHAEVRTRVCSDYADTTALAESAMLVTYTCDLVPDAAQTAALRSFLERGGRWLALHGTNSVLRFLEDGRVARPGPPSDFMTLLGSQFAAHPPIGSYKVEVSEPDHPLTAGLRAFKVVDELYLSRPTAEVRTLLHTEFEGECPDFEDGSWGPTRSPVMYLREVGRGAVLYLTLGHCRGHYDLAPRAPFYPHPERCAWNYPIFYELLRRGIGWAMAADTRPDAPETAMAEPGDALGQPT